MASLLDVLDVELPRQLTDHEWRRVQGYLDEWAANVKRAAQRHPKRSFELGYEQTIAYLNLIGKLATITGAVPVSLSQDKALKWLKRVQQNEIDGALARYQDSIRDALLHGVTANANPTQVAAWLYKLTREGEVNWRLIARTEMVRANAAGRLHACADQGYERVWVPPHVGSCGQCKRLLEHKVFRIEDVIDASNFGKMRPEDWVACIPLHPQCRHSYLPYDQEVYELAQQQYRLLDDVMADVDMPRRGGGQRSTERKVDAMFDEGGRLRPEYANAVDWSRLA